MRLARTLLQCYSTGHLDLYVEPLPFATAVEEFPVASPSARLQAKRSENLTTLTHSTTKLNDLERSLVPLLDGQHNQEMLVEELWQDVKGGKLVLREATVLVTNEQRTTGILNRMVAKQLAAMARRCLLAEV